MSYNLKRSRCDEDSFSNNDMELMSCPTKKQMFDVVASNVLQLPQLQPNMYDVEIQQLTAAVLRYEPRNIIKMYFPWYKPTDEVAIAAKLNSAPNLRLPRDVTEGMGLTNVKPYIKFENIAIDETHYSDTLKLVAAIDFITKKLNYATLAEMSNMMVLWNSSPTVASIAFMLLKNGGSIIETISIMSGNQINQADHANLLKEYIAYCGQIESNLTQFSIISIAKVIDISISQAMYCLINNSFSPHTVVTVLAHYD